MPTSTHTGNLPTAAAATQPAQRSPTDAHRKAVAELQVMFDAMQDAMLLLDPEGYILRANRAATRMFGRPLEALLHNPLRALLREMGLSTERCALDELQRTQEHQEYCLELDDGRTVLQVSIDPILDAGHLASMVAVIKDVTASHQASIELLRSEERYRTLISQAADPIFFLDVSAPDGPIIVETNERASAVYGYTRDELIGMPIANLLHASELEHVSQCVAQVTNGGRFIFEILHRRKDGTVFPVEVSAKMTEMDGRPHIIVFDRNISERKSLEAELIQAKNEWEETFHTINDAITIHDANYNIIRANRAAEQLLALSSEDLGHNKCFLSYHGTECPPLGCPSCMALGSGNDASFERYEPHLQRYLEIRALPRRDESGKVIGSVHVVRDISKDKEAEKKERRLQAQLQQAQKMESIGRLAGGVAHDFNNLLTVIVGNGETLLLETQANPNPYLNQVLGEMVEAGHKASALTRQLLAFSRKQALEMKVANLGLIVEQLEKMLRRLIGEDVQIEVDLQPVGNMLADPSQIEQVLLNLVVNARDAMPRGGYIKITTEELKIPRGATLCRNGLQPGSYALLSVQDTGEGFSVDIAEQIFEPFFTTKEMGKGTGLGLATAYGVVKQHGGHIEARSELGQGSIFRVYLPLTKVGDTQKTASSLGKMPGGSETILVVDDEPSVRRFVVRTLASLGYSVLQGASGEEALEVAGTAGNPIDLLLTDVVMPGLSGDELSQRLSAKSSRLKTIFITGYVDDMLPEHQILQQENTVVLHKPLRPSELANQVRRTLDAS